MRPAMLIDLTKCVGCKACVLACKEVNGLPEDGDTGLSATTWSTLQDHRLAGRQGAGYGEVHVRRQCMHCLDPACVSVCPVAALQKSPEGAVIYDADRCMGCRYCMLACPFGVPKYEWTSTSPRVQKCILCYRKRLQAGREPACTAACPTGASIFGDRDDLVYEALRRIETEPGRYVHHVYGLREAGGTSVLYLSAVPFAELGFPSALQDDTYPRLTWEVLSKIPQVVSLGGALLLGIWWLGERKHTVRRLAEGEITERDAESRHPSFAGSGRADREES